MRSEKVMTLDEMRKFAKEKQSSDPVYWGEWMRTLDRNFLRPNATKYKEWLSKQRLLQTVSSGLNRLDEEWAWSLTDDHVKRTRNRSTECYPVVFSTYAPIRISTPQLPDALSKGHLLLGFICEKQLAEQHPDSPEGEPRLTIDECFVLDCWDKSEVEPMLRGCFLYG